MTRLQVGVDVGGGRHDRTAITTLEHIKTAPTEAHRMTDIESVVLEAHRLPPATPLDKVTDHLVAMIDLLADDRVVLLIDATGIGAALHQLLTRALGEGRLHVRKSHLLPITLTGGAAVGALSIPKAHLVNKLLAAYNSGVLGFATGMADQEEMVRELVAFQPSVATDGRVTFSNNPSLSAFDDLVISLGLTLLHPEFGGTPRFRDHRGTLWASKQEAVNSMGEMALRAGAFHVTRDSSRGGED